MSYWRSGPSSGKESASGPGNFTRNSTNHFHWAHFTLPVDRFRFIVVLAGSASRLSLNNMEPIPDKRWVTRSIRTLGLWSLNEK
jgi:hypothetical protein